MELKYGYPPSFSKHRQKRVYHCVKCGAKTYYKYGRFIDAKTWKEHKCEDKKDEVE